MKRGHFDKLFFRETVVFDYSYNINSTNYKNTESLNGKFYVATIITW